MTSRPRISPHSNLSMVLVSVLIPIASISVIAWPIVFLLSIVPILGFFAVPLLVAISTILLYSIAWIPFLLLAQDDLPENDSSSKLLLPLSPIKAQRVVVKMIENVLSFSRSNWIELMLDYSYRKIIVLRYRPNNQQKIIKSDIIYSPNKNRLDVYLPIQSESLNPDDNNHPVLLFIHPGDWRWTDKSHYLQLGLRFRRFGYCVVIPDFTQFPDGRCDQATSDIKKALDWVHSSIRDYGGDANRIFLLGHGSGAHLAMLAVIETSIEQTKLGNPNQMGSKIEGLILLSGIYDPIRLLREQVRSSWHEVSCLRRFLGPTHTLTRSHSPTHMIHHASGYLNVNYLPPKILVIHGGQDDQVPIFQSQILCSLLVKMFDENFKRTKSKRIPELKFKAYKSLNHFDSLISLMIEPNNNSNQQQQQNDFRGDGRYSSVGKDRKTYFDSIINEILNLV
ncbi:lipase [Phakopsora pachyrhizi]|uniref:Lipase n=1 Tax=Phakopsora pachyrhizi TaxID=170000 RepID=A0AAV0AIV0_PHAPC|nr:lipase [Phakopsora pachyrhizi]CAH7668384.1 lipase [Phakopsora pachyrhizi]